MSSRRVMEGFHQVWDSGATMPWERPEVEDPRAYYNDFKSRTGSDHVVLLRWQYGGRTVECPLPWSLPLPDRTGVVIRREADPVGSAPRYLQVINADGSDRCRIVVPVVDEHSKPESGFLEMPKENYYDVAFGVPGNDGYSDYVFDFDWETGKFLRAVDAPHMRY